MTTTIISKHCATGHHNFCVGSRDTCACPTCHLGPCTSCGRDNLLTIFDGLCASCERSRIKNGPVHVQTCDQCGGPGAFRNPDGRKNEYFCNDCHSERGGVVLTPGVESLVMDCKGKPNDDERHVWVHVRGSRFRCRCTADRYDPALRAKRQRELEREYF